MTIISPDGTSPRAAGTAVKQPLSDAKRPSLPGEPQRQAWRKAMEAEQAASWFRRTDGVREPTSQVRTSSPPPAAALGRPETGGHDAFRASSIPGRTPAGESDANGRQDSTREGASRTGVATSARWSETGPVASVASDPFAHAGAAVDPSLKSMPFGVAPLPQLAGAVSLANVNMAESLGALHGPAPLESSTPAIQWRAQVANPLEAGLERAVDADASEEAAAAKATASAARDRNAAAFDHAPENAERVRVTWSRFGDATGTGVQVWLGASRSVQAHVPVLASQIARVLKNAGVRLAGVVVNGQPMDLGLESRHDEESSELRDAATHSRRTQWQVSER